MITSLKRLMLLGAAFTSFTLPLTAYAEEAAEPHFYPAKTWEVGSIKPMTDYSGECVIQTEFNNGFLMQMNGSSNWVQQLNLNIRQEAFEIGKEYNVLLDVPGRESVALSGTAHRANIITIPLKGQKEIFKAMRNNAVLDISIEDNKFRFFLTGFTKAANKFERCMAGALPDQLADSGLGGIVDANDADLSVSTKDLTDSQKDFLLNESIAFEQEEVTKVDAPVAQVIKAPEEVAEENIEKTVEVIEAVEVVEEAVIIAPKVEAEIDADDAKVNDTPANDTFTEEDAVAALNASAAAMIRERTQNRAIVPARNEVEAPQAISSPEPELEASDFVEPAVETVTTDTPEIAEVEAVEVEETIAVVVKKTPTKLPALEKEPFTPEPVKENKTSTADLLAEPDGSIDMPKVKVNRNTARGNADLTKVQPAKIQDADSAALARIVALEKDLAAQKAENEALNDELSSTLREGEREQLTVASDNWNLERATSRFNEAERQMKKLGQQLQKERAQWTMEKKELETMLFDPEVTSQEQLARLSKLEQELEATRAELEKAKASMAQ